MTRTQPVLFLMGMAIGAALMSLFQRVRLFRLRKENAALKVLVDRKCVEAAPKRGARYLGKVARLSEVAPNHPFARQAIVFGHPPIAGRQSPSSEKGTPRSGSLR